MKFSIKKLSSDKLGTYYGIFLASEMIHYEFSRRPAQKILEAISSGNTLYDVLFDQISHFCIRKKQDELNSLQSQIHKQDQKVVQLEREILKYKKLQQSESHDEELDLKAKSINFTAESLSAKHELSLLESNELSNLIKEMALENFTYSSDLSGYIKRNNLGEKYPNIAGVVTMENYSDRWKFEGGFPKNIYRIVCQELDLRDRGTSARAVDFLSYRQLSI